MEAAAACTRGEIQMGAVHFGQRSAKNQDLPRSLEMLQKFERGR